MPREAVPFATPDLSAFARSLGRALAEREEPTPPGHVEMLNLIARAAGHRNVQALRVAMLASPKTADTPAAAVALSTNAKKALRLFDDQDRLVQWPTKFSVQKLALWVLWIRFEPQRVYTEKEVNAVLKDANTFDDHVILRRELIDHRLMTRKSDGSEYQKLPAQPDEEVRALLTAWRARQRART